VKNLKSRFAHIFFLCLCFLPDTWSFAQTANLDGNTLICTDRRIPNFPLTRTIYVSKDRIFSYDGSPNETSKVGIIYQFGRQLGGAGSGDLVYQTSAQKNNGGLVLSATVSQTCGICNGHRITTSEQFTIKNTDTQWTAVRRYRQWFADGTRSAAPSGSEYYTCRVAPGRVGVGG